MDGNEVLDVLKEIRDETKQTNVRLDQTNERIGSLEMLVDTRLQSLEGRVEFLEKRVGKGFDGLTARIEAYAAAAAHRQSDSEVRLAAAVFSLQETIQDVRSLLDTKLDDHNMVIQHEQRIAVIETRLDDKPPK